jgi:hypothetical protein
MYAQGAVAWPSFSFFAPSAGVAAPYGLPPVSPFSSCQFYTISYIASPVFQSALVFTPLVLSGAPAPPAAPPAVLARAAAAAAPDRAECDPEPADRATPNSTAANSVASGSSSSDSPGSDYVASDSAESDAPAAPPPRGPARGRRPPPAPFHFGAADDALIVAMVRERGGDPRIRGWREIAAALGNGATWRQVAARWTAALRPDLAQDPLSLRDRRRMLQLGLEDYGNWSRISRHLGLGRSHSVAQVKTEICGMLARLMQLNISLHGAEEAECLPDRFFLDVSDGPGVREEFLAARGKRNAKSR